MKKTLLLCAAVLGFVLAGCEKKQHYTIDWDWSTSTGFRIDSVTLVSNSGQIAKAVVDSNRIHMEGEISEPALATLNMYFFWQGKSDSFDTNLILEGGSIQLKASPLNNAAYGTPSNDAILQVHEAIDSLYKAGEDYHIVVSNFIKEHKGDLCGAFMLYDPMLLDMIKREELKELYEGMDENIKALPELEGVKKRIESEESTAEGKMFTDFEATYEGKTTKLSDYVGKGQYVLVDFWASWCGPCRREIPNLKKIYEQYKGDNFTVLGVATCDEPANTLKAIEEDSVTYPQMIDAQKAGSDAYAIRGIPHIILFGPDGTILKRGLRGEEIEKAVKEFLVND